MGLSVLALVMVFLSVASPEALAASSTQLRESLISEGSSASDSAAAADDRNTASNFPVGSDSTPSKTRHEDAQSRSCAHKFCGLERGMFSHIRLIARDPVLTKIAWFAVFFAFAGACLSTVSAYTVSDLMWTQTEATLAFIAGGLIGLVSLSTSSCIVPRLGSLLSMVASSGLATSGLVIMCLSPISAFFFVVGFALLCTGAFGIVAYLSFVSERVDPRRQGEMQGAIGACGLAGFAIGQLMFSQLFLNLPEGTKWVVFVIGAAISAASFGLVFKLWSSHGSRASHFRFLGKALSREFGR